jgi:hypothetical protein
MARVAKEMVSDETFFDTLELWWPLHGGLREELSIIRALAHDQAVSASTVVFRMLRATVASGRYNE